MKSLKKYACAAAGLALVSGAAWAGVFYNNAEGKDGDTYYTVYSVGTEYAKVDIKDTSKRKALLSWSTKTGAGNDYAAGVGWGNSAKPKNLYYSLDGFKNYGTGDGAVFGAYGWSCNNVGELNVEFYITENWFQTDQFVPGGTSYKTTVTDPEGAKYKIYVGGALSRDQRCTSATNKRDFQQVWAVRQGKRSVGTSNVTMHFTTLMNKMDDYAVIRAPYPYLVIGMDGFPGSKGDVTIREIQRD